MHNLIEWPRAKYWDKAWNPIIGCKPCSPACEHCYAKAMAERFHKSFAPHASSHERPPRSGVVFCGNMTDLFGDWAIKGTTLLTPIERWLSETCRNRTIRYSLQNLSKDGTYLWLTKRAINMAKVLRDGKIDIGDQISHLTELASMPRFRFGKDLLSDNYFGFTAENQKWWETRIQQVLEMPDWANKWLSLEPLLGPVDLFPVVRENYPAWNFKWCVVGCESGPNRRPCKIEWVESIVEQCRTAKLPVFVKQLDINGRCVTDITKFPKHLQIRQVPWATKGNDHA